MNLRMHNYFINNIEFYKEQELNIEVKRKEFVEDYNESKLKELTLEEYCSGYKNSSIKVDYKTFCYRLEYDLIELGDIRGSTARKFGIYYSDKNKDYLSVKRYSGNNGFIRLKNDLIDLIKIGLDVDLEAVNDNQISQMIKSKILATYYPDKYLCISSDEHLVHFLNSLKVKFDVSMNFFEKQQLLMQYKNSNEVYKNWSSYIFMVYCYNVIGKPLTATDSWNSYTNQSYYNVDEIRLLPMSKDEFKTIEDVKAFVSGSLVKNGIYRYKRHSIITKYNVLVLFQYGGELIASAIMIDQEPQRININGHSYNGYYEFNKSTFKLFENGIKLKEIKDIDNNFKSFNQSAQIIDLSYLNSIILLIDYKCTTDININEIEDARLVADVSIIYEAGQSTGYSREKVLKPEPKLVEGHIVYKRDRNIAFNALAIAKNKCEINKNHRTFRRKSNPQIDYTEPHHLIPMSKQNEYDVSLDREQNIVSLCSNCHNEIHYGANSKHIITELYQQRKYDLKEIGINITLKKLASYYGF